MTEHHRSGDPMTDEPYNQRLCDERHKKLDNSIEKLQGILNTFTILFVGAIVSSAFAVFLTCVETFGGK